MTSSANTGQLPKRPFGQTDLLVTTLCIGCAELGDMPDTFTFSVTEEQALATLRSIFKSPINFIDTAASYGDGESERRIGLVLKELGGVPTGCVVATKADRNLQTGDFSGEQMKRSVERSLRLLGLDRLEIVYLHDAEHTTFENVMSRGGPLEVLLKLRDEGIIGHVGIAGGPIDQELRYVETGAFEAVITHNRYTLLNRSAAPLLDLAAQRGIAVLNAAPYGGGILAKGPDAYARYAYTDAPQQLMAVARRMAELCQQQGVPLAAAALQFSLRDPRITSTIVGISHPERVTQTLDLARHPIPEALWAALDAIPLPTGDPETTPS